MIQDSYSRLLMAFSAGIRYWPGIVRDATNS
jgi:hypothetical protein